MSVADPRGPCTNDAENAETANGPKSPHSATKAEDAVKALLQRVSRASVVIDGNTVGEIGAGLLVLLCAEKGDTATVADKMLAKILKLRVFTDDQGKMNWSVQNMDGAGGCGGLLVVSQFTLAADTTSGTRPGFSAAAAPAQARELFDYFLTQARAAHPIVQTGQFGADMQVHLVNNGPVTIPLQIGVV